MRQGTDIDGLAGAFRLKAPWYRSFRNSAVRSGGLASAAMPPPPPEAPAAPPAEPAAALPRPDTLAAPAAPPAAPPADPAVAPATAPAANHFRLLHQALEAPPVPPLPGLSTWPGAAPPPAGPQPQPGRMRLIAAAFSPACPAASPPATGLGGGAPRPQQ